MKEKVILVTGASSGIGEATVEQLVKDGYTVYGSVLEESEFGIVERLGAIPIQLDVTQHASLEKAVKQIISEQGGITVLVNNAGYGVYGAVEDVPIDDARNQFEVNLFGLARLTQLVIPHMRKQGNGMIINISSIGGKVYSPLGAWYYASKHAVEGWSDCLRLELKQFGIKVVIIEPGAIRTQFGVKLLKYLKTLPADSLYKDMMAKVVQLFQAMEQPEAGYSPPSVIGQLISKVCKAKPPLKARYAAGKYAKSMLFFRKYFSDKFFDRLTMKQFG